MKLTPEIQELIAERERAYAYGLHKLVKVVDAEIGRLMIEAADAAPIGRTAPARQTTEAPVKRGPGRPRKITGSGGVTLPTLDTKAS